MLTENDFQKMGKIADAERKKALKVLVQATHPNVIGVDVLDLRIDRPSDQLTDALVMLSEELHEHCKRELSGDPTLKIEIVVDFSNKGGRTTLNGKVVPCDVDDVSSVVERMLEDFFDMLNEEYGPLPIVPEDEQEAWLARQRDKQPDVPM
jgi:hypothetical protein